MNKKDKSIFTKQNQIIIRLFQQAKHPDKVLCVPIDYAKGTHMALFCNGSGQQLRKAFPVKNSPDGMVFLLDAVDKICRKFAIKREHVFFGGEACGTFADNFIYALRKEGFVVVGVHAADAKKERENMQASTDKLDLLGIAKMLLNRRGSFSATQTSRERALRSLTRHRNSLVEMRTATSNRIHGIVDRLFPGFLDEKCSGIPPFSKAALYLMENHFSSAQIAKRQDKALLRQLKTQGLQHAEDSLIKLKTHAKSVLEHPPELVAMLQVSLSSAVKLYRSLSENIEQIGYESAQQLAQTSGAMLTTMRGIGITLAAGVAAEIGPPKTQTSTRRLTSYAGIIPRVKQTGGPEKSARTGKVSRRSNHILKNFVVQCGNHLGQHGPAELKEDHQRRSANSQHADFGMARRYLRIGMRLMRNNECYIPSELRQINDENDLHQLRTYYLQLWPKILEKWKKAKAIETAFAEENPLGQWKRCIEAIYDIKLPVPKKH